MRLAGHDATRIHGTLSVALADGREAWLDIDLDVSDPRSFIELENHYEERPPYLEFTTKPLRCLGQSLAIHWPTPLHPLRDEEPPPPLTIRVPVDGRA